MTKRMYCAFARGRADHLLFLRRIARRAADEAPDAADAPDTPVADASRPTEKVGWLKPNDSHRNVDGRFGPGG